VNIPSNLKAGIVSLFVVMAIGSIGFVVIGDLTIGDALYVTIITISTLGYSEIGGPFLGATRMWVAVVLISGMGAALYTATAAVEYGFETVVGSDYRKRRKMQKDVSSMKDHIIVCGYGRVGVSAWGALTRDGLDVVVIDRDPAAVEAAMKAGAVVVEGDATRDDVLSDAGVATARAVIAAVASPSDNMVITLSVKAGYPDLPVTARAIDHETERKLTLAGADAVVTPELVGGERIAAFATQSGLAEFLDTVVHSSAVEFRIQRFIVPDRSPVVGQTIADLNLRRNSGAMVIGVAPPNDTVKVNPDPNTPFTSGDLVFGLGTASELARLEAIFADAP
jgi:voltage-gated potassium channel